MKKAIYLKSIFLLICTLFAGVVNAQLVPDPEKYDHEWAKVTDLSKVESGDVVLLVDVSKNIALPNNNTNFIGASVTINEDGTIADGVSDNIKWVLTKNEDGTFSFKHITYTDLLHGYTSGELSVGYNASFANGYDYSSKFRFDNYGENGGQLGFMFNSFLGWDNRDGKYYGRIKDSAANITLYKRAFKNYVKWKKVDGANITLDNNDIVVIVDLATGRAMSNDKADKDPDAVAVTLNDDKDRILDEVPEKVQWTFTNNGGKYKFAVDDENLYAESKGLKVGTETTNNEFDFGTNQNGPYLGITIDNTNYFAGVDASMFSNVWKLVEGTDDIAKDTKVAIFKKVVDPQKVVKIELAKYYEEDLDTDHNKRDFNNRVTITGAEKSEISWSSSKEDVAKFNFDNNDADGVLTLRKRGSTVITAKVEADFYHDKASAKCTLTIEDNSDGLGTLFNPLTVSQALDLIKNNGVEEGVLYYIKGKVCKVNSGMMAMFGDMDFGSMGGSGSGSSSFNFEDSMDDMDFDPEDMEESGFDMSSFDMSSFGFDMSAMFGTSDKVTYYISDDGVKDKEKQLKVLNGNGLIKGNVGGVNQYDKIPDLSPGDWVVVCGPLVKSKDESMFSSFMGNDEETWKVGEENYLNKYDQTLYVRDTTIYVNKTVDGDSRYSIDDKFDDFHISNGEIVVEENKSKFPQGLDKIQPATFKSSDEEIAKWDDKTNLITGVNEGKAKITVKVKVIVTPDDPNTEDNDERSYTMKRKFRITVLTRDLDPAGYYDGEWVLTTSAADLYDGARLVLAGTRVKEGKDPTDYMMVENNAMMGGGKNGSKIEFEDSNKETIPSSTVTSKKGLEVVLEKDKVNESLWMLKVGINEENDPLYLYATYAPEEEQSDGQGDGQGEGQGDGQGGNQFDMKKMMEMFDPSSGMKVGTIEEANQDAQDNDVIVSLKASISFTENSDIATIKFIFDGTTDDTKYNNTIMLSSSFDMEEMMGMFGGTGEGGNNGMGDFDMFMASFNTKKSGDENAQEGKDPKCFMPRIYRFVPNSTFDITIGSTAWRTIVSYKDVQIPEDEPVDVYIVTGVQKQSDRSLAILSLVEDKKLAGGAPYLLHYTSPANNYTMNVLAIDEANTLEAPTKNKLKKSDRTTKGSSTSSTVYVLANKSFGPGFYRWIGEELGAGRVYLPVGASGTTANAHEYCGFFVDETGEATAIESIDNFKANVGPFYDLQGRRVDNPSKGIYIVNGKKVIVK